MSRSHIAYGPKDAIGKVIAGRHIPTNCLVITKVEDPAEEAELLYFDKDYTPHQISMRHVFPSIEVATEWVGRYYCVGRHIVVKDGDEWHSYIVGDDNELIVADGTDKVSIVTAGDASVVVNGETMTPTISVNLDPEFANGLSISEDGLMLNVATDSKAGAMSASDKFKLDEIEAGAQVNTITDIGTGSANGTISVNGVDVTVKGLGSAAFTDSDAYTPAGVGMSYMIVEELPADGAVGVIYLVPNEGEGDNVYDEFLYVDGEPELIGTTETDLSDYYTKNEVVNVIRSEVDDAITGKVDTISLARVATTGSFNDLNDKPGIPIVLDVAKRNDGLYYPSITYAQGIAILESGGQISIHWPENNLVYQCKQWRSTSSSIFFGTQDENTYRVLRWNSHTGTVEPFSNNTFATSANLSDKVDKVSGKGLSTNDFTNAEKSKLAGFGDASLYALKSEINIDGKVDKEPGKGLSTNDFTNEEKNKLAGFGNANIYALKEDLNSIYRYKGSVSTESALPNSGTNVAGDVYNVEENGMNYAWNGTSWDALGADPEEPVEVDPISNSSIDDIIGSGSSSSDPSDAIQTIETDRSLSHDGVPADAKAAGDAIAAEASARQTQVAALQNAVGSPLVANTAAGMTSTDKIYVYTGSETGYTAGHWYYHDGSAWTDGGVYNSIAFNTDTTLSVGGMAADAEATGDEIADLKSAIDNIDTAVFENKTKEQSVHITDTFIPASTVIISDVNITEGSKYTLTIRDPDGIINQNSSNVKDITVYRVDSDSQMESIGAVVIDEPKQFTASVNIIGFTIYKGANSVTPSGDIVCKCTYEAADGQNSIQYRLSNVESRVDDTDEYLDEIRELETIVAGSDAINYVEDKRIGRDGSLVNAPEVCVSEKITYDWTGYRRYYCNDNSVKFGYEIAFYNSNDVLLAIFKNPPSAGGSLFRAIDAETQVTGTPAYVRFSFKKGTVGKIEESSNISPKTFWFAQTIHTNGIAEEIDRMISAYVGSNSATISTDSLSSDTSLILDSAPWFIKKNVGITATMKFNSFTDVTIGKGHENYRGRWIKIDGTNITPYYYNGTETAVGDAVPHGLSISNFLNVSMYMANDGNCRVSINSMTGTFSTQIDFEYEWNYAPFVFGSQAMTDVKLNYSCADLRCPLWLFGDSYMGVAVTRIAGQLKNLGYFNICIDAIAGGKSIDSGTPGKSIYDDFLRMLTFTRPKFVIWTLGMNGGDAMNVNFLPTLIEKCEAENIELILYISPNVPEYNHDTLNAYIKSLNIRYIDGYDAVGANTQGEWYGHGTENDFLSSDDIHPSSLGAKALAMRFIIDAPEIVQYGYTTGSVNGDEH